jgi:peptidoglycan L-alanyl-D-glutamate endopeptidase CwlK
MSKFVLGKRSLKNLEGVHPDLVSVVKLAIKLTPIDFTVIEGVRSKERQAALFKSGASMTMNSRHITGHAVDIAPWVDGKVSWDWDHYYPLAAAVFQAASETNIPVEWGGHWRSFPDAAHWQLPWSKYPAEGSIHD